MHCNQSKEEEVEIGNPTDVKHVAHIGWDGPSASASTAPSWMTEFNSGGVFESGEGGGGDDDDSPVKCVSECGGRSRDLPKLPKSTRKSSRSEKGSPTKEKSSSSSSSDKTKRRSPNKKGTSSSSSSRRAKEANEEQDDDFSSWPRGLVEIPKKSMRKKKKKKTKESANGGGSSTRSARRADVDNMSEYMSETGSVRSMPQFDCRDDF